jgi:hypothetical protein
MRGYDYFTPIDIEFNIKDHLKYKTSIVEQKYRYNNERDLKAFIA